MDRHWYFDGYEAQPRLDPKKKKMRNHLVYTGEYYGLKMESGQYKKTKRILAAGYVVMVILYLLLSLLPTECADTILVAVPLLAELLPLIFLTMGIVMFLKEPQKWPKRLVRSIQQRIRWSSILLLLFSLVACGGEIAACAILKHFSVFEMIYLLGLLVMGAFPLSVLVFQHRWPAGLIAD